MTPEILAQTLQRELEDQIDAAAGPKAQAFFAQLAADAMDAAALGDEALLKEIQAQAQVRGETLRLGIGKRGWATVRGILVGAVAALLQGAASAATGGVAATSRMFYDNDEQEYDDA